MHEVSIKISINGSCTNETIHRYHVGCHSPNGPNGPKGHHCPNHPNRSSMVMTIMPINVLISNRHHGHYATDHYGATPDYWYLSVFTG